MASSARIARLISVTPFCKLVKFTMPLESRPSAALLLIVLAGFLGLASSQGLAIGSLQGSGANSAPAAMHTIRGRVINAITGAPLPRALVTLASDGTRSILTDPLGRFEFAQFQGNQAFPVVSKPGYSNGSQADTIETAWTNLDLPMELKLYPDALVTGTVTAPDGLPLSSISVQLRRASYVAGPQRWTIQRSVQTNSHGEYRFLIPAGRYRVTSNYSPRARDTGEALLPASFPDGSATGAQSYFAIASAEQKFIDLRPRMGPAYPVLLDIQPADRQNFIQISATTPNGETFQVPRTAGPITGSMQVSLPRGAYTIKATQRENKLEGSARLVVTGASTAGVAVHLDPLTAVSIELSVDPAVSASGVKPIVLAGNNGATRFPSTPQLNYFNMRLHNQGNGGDGYEQDVNLVQREDKSFGFDAAPGRYRLLANIGGGGWWLESVTAGITDLASSDLVIAPGGSSAQIRVLVTSLAGTISGRANATSGWVYAIPEHPAVAALQPVLISSGGLFYFGLPPGTYTLVAVDHRLDEDTSGPGFLASFVDGLKSVTVVYDAPVQVNLEIAQRKETPR